MMTTHQGRDGGVVFVYKKESRNRKDERAKRPGGRPRGRPRKTDPRLPPKPRSAFLIFAEEHRPKVLERLTSLETSGNNADGRFVHAHHAPQLNAF